MIITGESRSVLSSAEGNMTYCIVLLTTLSQILHSFDFDVIECFTTTFLRAHSWLNWVDDDDDDDDDDDEDEVGLKEKPEDTRYIKKITSK